MLSHPSVRALFGMNILLVLCGLGLLPAMRSAARPPRSGVIEPRHLHWVRHEPPLEPTWPDQPRFTSDAAFRPVPVGSLVLATSSRHDCLTAVDADSGEVRWRFVTDAPVRFAPAVWHDRVFVASDDGHLYCLAADDGALVWKFRGGPAERWLLGNERLIATWPARGGPVVTAEPNGEATVYFAAGIWPFMGVFLHALDARTGRPRWQNAGEGSLFIKQPHHADAFAGIAPQGSLVVEGDRLLVPGGRSIAAGFDRHSGKRLHYRLADSSKLGGGPDLVVSGGAYLNGGGLFDLASGDFLGAVAGTATLADGVLYHVTGTTCHALTLEKPTADGVGKKGLRLLAPLGSPLGTARVPPTTALLVAHGHLYGGGPGVVYAVKLPLRPDGAPLVWQQPIEGTPLHLAMSADHLFVSTREGRLYAFGGEGPRPRTHPLRLRPLPPAAPPQTDLARRIVAKTGVSEGYAVVWGIGSGGLIAELLRDTTLRLIVLEPNEERVETMRDLLREAGIDGKRVSVRHATTATASLPPYLASLVVAEDLGGFEPDAVFFDRVWSSLRPYGGVACLPLGPPARAAARKWRDSRSEEGAQLREDGDLVVIRRDGGLPGAGDWTHEHADAANTRVSADQRVKAPLGLLWFGGPGHQGILPRHGHGPVPQSAAGRLVIEGPDRLRAIDVYTGRLLWEKELPGLGAVYDNTSHQPGANGVGSNYVTTADGIYVAHRDRCLLLDLATGRTLREYRLPPLPGEKAAPPWRTVRVVGEYLITGSGAVEAASGGLLAKVARRTTANPGIRRLSVLDRGSGAVRWSADAQGGFWPNAICVGNGRLYAIDRGAAAKAAKGAAAGRVVAFNLASGRMLWRQDRDVFGTWLSYSTGHDVLVEAGWMSRDTLRDEPAGMRAYRGSDGVPLWYEKGYFGPALIHGDRILKGGDAAAGSGTACDLHTGRPIRIADPLTGEPIEWRWQRTYGCNTPAASEHLVLFRSGAAGFYDLCHDGGTGNLGGFRSSCTLNLIPAGGVLTVPDYTRTCTCSYQQQTSVGLIHTPDAELWTFTTARPVTGAVRRVGINLGAPGSRKADDGTLWLEHPRAGGPSPKLAVVTVPPQPETFRLHAAQVAGDRLGWVGASGCRGLTRLTLALGTDAAATGRYTVRLVFLEPDAVGPGERRFDVAIEGQPVLTGFDVCREAGGPRRVVVREFPGVTVTGELEITLTPTRDTAIPAALLSGVEVIREGN